MECNFKGFRGDGAVNFNNFLCTRKKYLKMKEEFDCEIAPIVEKIDKEVKEWLLKTYPFGDGYNNLWYLYFNFRIDYDLVLNVSYGAYNLGYIEYWEEIKIKIESLISQYPFIEKVEFK